MSPWVTARGPARSGWDASAGGFLIAAPSRKAAGKCQEVVLRVENALPVDTGGESDPQWPELAGLGRP
jgi:hypothetical protein